MLIRLVQDCITLVAIRSCSTNPADKHITEWHVIMIIG